MEEINDIIPALAHEAETEIPGEEFMTNTQRAAEFLSTYVSDEQKVLEAWKATLKEAIRHGSIVKAGLAQVILTEQDKEWVQVYEKGRSRCQFRLVNHENIEGQLIHTTSAEGELGPLRSSTTHEATEQPPLGWHSREVKWFLQVMMQGGYSPAAERLVLWWAAMFGKWIPALVKRESEEERAKAREAARTVEQILPQSVTQSVLTVPPPTYIQSGVRVDPVKDMGEKTLRELRRQLKVAEAHRQPVIRATLFNPEMTTTLGQTLLIHDKIISAEDRSWLEWPIDQLVDTLEEVMRIRTLHDKNGVTTATDAIKGLGQKGLYFTEDTTHTFDTIKEISKILGELKPVVLEPQKFAGISQTIRVALFAHVNKTEMGKAMMYDYNIMMQDKKESNNYGLQYVWGELQKLYWKNEVENRQHSVKWPSSSTEPEASGGKRKGDSGLNTTYNKRGGPVNPRGGYCHNRGQLNTVATYQGRGGRGGYHTQGYHNQGFENQGYPNQGRGGRGYGHQRGNSSRGGFHSSRGSVGRGGGHDPYGPQGNRGERQVFPGGRPGNAFGQGLCNACGKPHTGNCAFLGENGVGGHPDVNREHRPFVYSTNGKKWNQKQPGTYELPCRKTLSGGVYEPPEEVVPRGRHCKYAKEGLNNIDSKLGDIKWRATEMFVVPPTHIPNALPYRVEALLDSGSIGSEGNYISHKLGEKLAAWGYVGKKSNKVVCSCFEGVNECRPCSTTYKLKLKFVDWSGVEQTVTTTVHEIQTSHDLIIGYEDLVMQQALRTQLITQMEQEGEHRQNDHGHTSETPQLNEAQVRRDGTDHPIVSDRRSRKRAKVMTEVRARRLANISENKVEEDENTPENILKMLQKGNLGPKELQERVTTLCRKMQKNAPHFFSTGLNKEGARVNPLELFLNDEEEWHSTKNSLPPRVQSRVKQEEIIKQIEKMLKAGIIRVSKATAYSQVMMTPKTDGSWRFCIDFRRLNLVTNPVKFPLPRIQDILDRIGQKKAKYYAVLDLTKGYYQAPLSEASKVLTAFITPHGLFEWDRVAMGLKGAPGYFQRALATEVLYGLLYAKCELYLDDIIVFGRTQDEFMANLEAVFERLAAHNIVVNPKKCKMGMSKVEYVGYTIDETGSHFCREKLQKVIDMEKPKSYKQLKTFIGVVSHFRTHIRNHSAIMHPLTELSAKEHTGNIEWTTETNKAFEEIKRAVNNCPKLFFFDEHSPVHLYTDASDYGIGGYLCQIVDGEERPIAFYSKSLTKEERKWGTPCLEGYAIYKAFHHFHYLLRDAQTTVHTDHANLIYIRDTVESKVIRWKLELQEYDFTLEYVKGELNEIADFWSRNVRAEVDDTIHAPARQAVNMLNRIWVDERTPCGVEENEYDERDTMVGSTFLFQKAKTCHNQCNQCNANSLNVTDTWKHFQIPNERYDDIRSVHNQWAGHHGVDTTIELLKKKGKVWKYMREHVRKYIYECDVCQKNTYTGHEVQIPRYIIGRYSTMERLGIDTIHTPGDELGNNYIVAMIDHFTRFLQLYPVKDITKETIAGCIMTHAGTFGIPCELCSDRGSEYVNDIIQALVDFTGTEHVVSMAYSKEENGIVERSNKETWRWMRAIVNDRRIGHHRVSRATPFVTRIHNAKKVKSLGYSPGQMVFGQRIELDKNIFLPREVRVETRTNITQWIQEQEELQNLILTIAAEQQTQYDNRNRVKRTARDNEHATREFPVGTYVLSAYPPTDYGQARPNKLHPMLQGPFEVVGRDNHVIQLRNLVSKKQVERNIKLLRPFQYDPTRTNPRVVALNDYHDEFEIEAILSHTGQWNRKQHMTFKVRWLGYDETWDTEEYFKNLKFNDVFRDYVTAQGYERLLPTVTE